MRCKKRYSAPQRPHATSIHEVHDTVTEACSTFEPERGRRRACSRSGDCAAGYCTRGGTVKFAMDVRELVAGCQPPAHSTAGCGDTTFLRTLLHSNAASAFDSCSGSCQITLRVFECVMRALDAAYVQCSHLHKCAKGWAWTQTNLRTTGDTPAERGNPRVRLRVCFAA
ncbi:hypothetical protein BD310DRAFT_922195 [Dichomitus squalens]|uniref:Uncharacterized protein n=1 Tax=Dichomitus squalens TaxID=114155 RepID=A0A4Q9Q195_9APHY|nr:hypothetical protein BD310DRAFT_922195 [Dichomitus squalens]